MKKEKLRFLKLVMLFLIILCSLVMAVSSKMTYVFTIKNEKGVISPYNLELFEVQFGEDSNDDEGNYKVDLVSGDKVLYSVKFDFVALILPSISDECISDENGEVVCEIYPIEETIPIVTINLPCLRKANSVRVYGSENFLFDYPVPGYRGHFNYALILIPAVLISIILVVLIAKKHKTKGAYPPNY